MSAHRSVKLKSRRWSGAWLVGLSLACAPTEEPMGEEPSPVEAPKPPHELLRWGKLMAPGPGIYRGKGSYYQHGFLTMERTLFESIESHWEFELGAGGDARLCTQGLRRSGGSVSQYASQDGKDHHREDETPWLSCMSGRWQANDASSSSVLVTLERASYVDPEVREGAFDAQPGTTALCWGLDAVHELRGPILACRFHGELYQSEQVALAVQGTSRDGSWTLREDITRTRAEVFAPDASPWIIGLAGASGEGLVVQSRDDGPGRGGSERVELDVSRGQVPQVEARRR